MPIGLCLVFELRAFRTKSMDIYGYTRVYIRFSRINLSCLIRYTYLKNWIIVDINYFIQISGYNLHKNMRNPVLMVVEK